MKKEFVRNPYNYDSDKASDESGLACLDESRTQQQFLEESDINYIAEKFMRTGEIKQVIDMPTSGEFEGIFDFQSAMNLIKDAKDQFMTLPAKVRSRFDNDPQKLIEFLDDDENREEAEALRLIQPKEKTNGNGPAGESTAREPGETTTRKAGSPGNSSPNAPGKEPGQKAPGEAGS